MREFDLIDRIRARAPARDDVLLGIGDDCALLQPPAGMQLVVTMDTLNAGVHFPQDTAAFDIGWKALAVNLSDLAAMGAQPAWCTLSLALPEAEPAFVDGLLDGLFAVAQASGIALVGGDTTRGPLSLAVTAHGFVEPGQALRRAGARAGDELWVSGTLGDAAGALAQWRAGEAMDAELRARLDRPTPRLALGRALRGLATACIDLSDGLLADLGHLCRASGVGARVDVEALPASAALQAAFDSATRHRLQAGGGDDYELCFSAPADRAEELQAVARASGVTISRVGVIRESTGVAASRDGTPWSPSSVGWDHFR